MVFLHVVKITCNEVLCQGPVEIPQNKNSVCISRVNVTFYY